jgi:SEC-C motif domain protein
MRSRYSAFAVADADYLLATWHPSTRPRSLDMPVGVEWRHLEIRSHAAGGEDDHAGTVEFVAQYWDAATGRFGEQRETSAFRREAGHWFYVGPVTG